MPESIVTSSTADSLSNTTSLVPEVLSKERWATIDFGTLFSEWTQQLINFGVRVLLAVLIFYVGRLISRYILRLINKAMQRRNLDLAVQTFLHSLMNIVLFVIVIVAAVNALGVAPVSFAALMAAAGVTIGASLSGQLQNLAGGVILLITRPFRVGDYIAFTTVEGFVSQVAIFYTTLTTADNKVIHIPNGKLSSDAIINYSERTKRRCQIMMTVDYLTPFEEVKRVAQQVVDASDRVLRDEPITIVLHEMTANSVNVMLRVWCRTEDYWDLYWDLNRDIYAAFNREGISFAFPQLRIHHDGTDVPQVGEKE